MLLIVYPIIFFIPPHDKLDEFVKIPFFEGLVKLTYPFIFTPFKIDASSFVNFSENYLAFLSFYLWYLVFVALLFLLYISFICLNINRERKQKNKNAKTILSILQIALNVLSLAVFVLYCIPQALEKSIPWFYQAVDGVADTLFGTGLLKRLNFFGNVYVSEFFYCILVQSIINLFVSLFILLTGRKRTSSYGSLAKVVKKGRNRPIMSEKQDYQIIPSGLFTGNRERQKRKRLSYAYSIKMSTDYLSSEDESEKIVPTTKETNILDSLEPVNLDSVNTDIASSADSDDLISQNELYSEYSLFTKETDIEKSLNALEQDSYQSLGDDTIEDPFAKSNAKSNGIMPTDSDFEPLKEDVYSSVEEEDPLEEKKIDKKELKRQKKFLKEEKKKEKKAKKKAESISDTPLQNEEKTEEKVEEMDLGPDVEIIKEGPGVPKKKITNSQVAVQPDDSYDTSLSNVYGGDTSVSQDFVADETGDENQPIIGTMNDFSTDENVDDQPFTSVDSGVYTSGGNGKVVFENVYDFKYVTEQTTLYKRWQDKLIKIMNIFFIVIFTLFAILAVLLYTPIRDYYFDNIASLTVYNTFVTWVENTFYKPFNLVNPLANSGFSRSLVATTVFFVVVASTAVVLLLVHLCFVSLNYSKRRGKKVMWLRVFFETVLVLADLAVLVGFFLLLYRENFYESAIGILYKYFDIAVNYISVDSPATGTFEFLRNVSFNVNPQTMLLAYLLTALVIVNLIYHLFTIIGKNHPFAVKWKKEYRRVAKDSGKVVRHLIGRGSYGRFSGVFGNSFGEGVPTHIEYENYNDYSEKNVILVRYRPVASIIATVYNDIPIRLEPDLTIDNNSRCSVEEIPLEITTLNDNQGENIVTKQADTFERWHLPLYIKKYFTSDVERNISVRNVFESIDYYLGKSAYNKDDMDRAYNIYRTLSPVNNQYYDVDYVNNLPDEDIKDPWEYVFDEPISEDNRVITIYSSLDISQIEYLDVLDVYERIPADEVGSNRAYQLYLSIDYTNEDNLDVSYPEEDKAIEDRAESIRESLDVKKEEIEVVSDVEKEVVEESEYDRFEAYEVIAESPVEEEQVEGETVSEPLAETPVKEVEVIDDRSEKIRLSLDRDDSPVLLKEIDSGISPFTYRSDERVLPEPWPALVKEAPIVEAAEEVAKEEAVEPVVIESEFFSYYEVIAPALVAETQEETEPVVEPVKVVEEETSRAEEIEDSIDDLRDEKQEIVSPFDDKERGIILPEPWPALVKEEEKEDVSETPLVEEKKEEPVEEQLEEEKEETREEYEEPVISEAVVEKEEDIVTSREKEIKESLDHENDECKLLEVNRKFVSPFDDKEKGIILPEPWPALVKEAPIVEAAKEVAKEEVVEPVVIDSDSFSYYEVIAPALVAETQEETEPVVEPVKVVEEETSRAEEIEDSIDDLRDEKQEIVSPFDDKERGIILPEPWPALVKEEEKEDVSETPLVEEKKEEPVEEQLEEEKEETREEYEEPVISEAVVEKEEDIVTSREKEIKDSLDHENDECKLLEVNRKFVSPFDDKEKGIILPEPWPALVKEIPVVEAVEEVAQEEAVEPVVIESESFSYYEVVAPALVAETQEETKSAVEPVKEVEEETSRAEEIEDSIDDLRDEKQEIVSPFDDKEKGIILPEPWPVIAEEQKAEEAEIIETQPAVEEVVTIGGEYWEIVSEPEYNFDEQREEDEREEESTPVIEEIIPEEVESQEQPVVAEEKEPALEQHAEEDREETRDVDETVIEDEGQFEFYEVIAPVAVEMQEEKEPTIEPVEDEGQFEYYEVIAPAIVVETQEEKEPAVEVIEPLKEVENVTEPTADIQPAIETNSPVIIGGEYWEVVSEPEYNFDEQREEESQVEEKEEEKPEVIVKPKSKIRPVTPIKHEEVVEEKKEEKVIEKISGPLHSITANRKDIKPVAPRHVSLSLKQFMIDKYDGFLTPEEAFERGIARVRSTISPIVSNKGVGANQKKLSQDDLDNITKVDDLSKYKNIKSADDNSKVLSIKDLKKKVQDKKNSESKEAVEDKKESIKPIKPIKVIDVKKEEEKEEVKEVEEKKDLSPIRLRHSLSNRPKPNIKLVDPTKKK